MTSPKKNQGRDSPAFQEYAASMMSKMEYRLLNLSQRGLLYTLRLECWVNQSLPRDPKKLATVLGLPPDEVAAALPTLSDFFQFNGELLVCPELEQYRETVQDRRNRQSAGGKESRKRHKEKLAFNATSNVDAPFNHDASSLQVLRQDKLNINKTNTVTSKERSIQEILNEDDCPF